MEVNNSLPPDDPGDLTSPGRPDDDLIQRVLTAGETAVEELTRTLLLPIVSAINDAETLIEESRAQCTGEVCHHASAAESTIEKLTSKLLKESWGYISSAYGTMAQLGLPYPSNEQVLHGLGTGDYLGSMAPDFVPPADDAPLYPTTGEAVTLPAVGPSGYTGPTAPADVPLYVPPNQNPTTGNTGSTGSTENTGHSGAGGATNNGAVASGVGAGTVVLPTAGATQALPAGMPAGSSGNAAPAAGDFGGVHATQPTTELFDQAFNVDYPIGCRTLGRWYTWPQGAARNVATLEVNRSVPALADKYWTWPELYEEFVSPPGSASRSRLWTVLTPTGPQYVTLYIPPNTEWHSVVGVGDGNAYLIATEQINCPPAEPWNPPPPQPPPEPPSYPPPQPPAYPPGSGEDCAGVIPMMPRFDTAIQCAEASFDAAELARRWQAFWSGLTPTDKGPAIRPNSTIGGAVFDVLNVITWGGLTVLSNLPYVAWKYLGRVMRRMACMSGCNPDKLKVIVPTLSAAGFLNRMFGGTLNFLVRPWQHTLNKECPYELPEPAAANAAYLAGAIDKHTWECWVQAQGYRLDPQGRLVHAARTRPNVHELTLLMLRGKITEQQWQDSLRELGVTEAVDRNRYRDLIQAMPGVDDVIRFMVRDVGDAELKKKFGMMDEFENKWQGRLKEYAAAQGIPDTLAEDYWAAHWYLPSPTQLYEMYHRFADDRKDVPDGLKVSKETIREALIQQDILPYWIDRLVAVSNHPLTRVDAQRAYKIGAIDERQLYGAYRDLGYDDERATTLVRFTQKLVEQADKKIPGLPTYKTYIDAYTRMEISAQQLSDGLFSLGMSRERIPSVLQQADEARTIRTRTNRIKSIKKLFEHAMIDNQETQARLSIAGVDADAVTALVDEWEEYRSTRGKMPSVANLCTWASNGWIRPDEHLTALKRLGYDEDSAFLLAAECKQKATAKAIREAERFEAKRQASEERAKRKAEQTAAKLLRELKSAIDETFDGETMSAKLLDKVDKWLADNAPSQPA